MKQLHTPLLSMLLAGIFLFGCTEDEEPIDITGINWDGEILIVTEGFSYDLTEAIEVIGDDAEQAVLSFSSGDMTIVSVNGNTLKAEKVGKTTLTAKESVSGLTETIDVDVIANVVAVTQVTLDKEEATLLIGIKDDVTEAETVQLTATVAPEDATEKGLTWSVNFPSGSKVKNSTPEEIATVSADGLVTAVSEGEVEVVVTTLDGEFEANTKITVSNVKISAITISPSPIEVEVNESVQLSAETEPANAFDKTFTWSIAMEGEGNVADYLEIDVDGVLKALQRCDECEFTVTASSNDGAVESSKTITILFTPVTSVSLDMETLLVNIGETGQLTATVLPENATNKNVTWSLTEDDGSPETYATVDAETGIVTGISECDACGLALVVTTEDGEFTTYADLFIAYYATSVTIVDSDGIPFDDKELNVTCYEEYQLYTTVLPDNASDKTITWSVTSGGGISVTSSGLLELDYSGGSARITAMTNDGTGLSDYVDVYADNCEP